MVYGFGCLVCVILFNLIDKVVYLVEEKNVIFCFFGDMLCVLGFKKSLLEVKVNGVDICILYFFFEVVNIVKDNLDWEVVFFVVGFEIIVLANVFFVVYVDWYGLKNYFIFILYVFVLFVIEVVMDDEVI